jgi:hypothetical protein
MSVSWQIRKAQLLRDDLAALHLRDAASLPEVQYDHDGAHWAEWLMNIAASLDGPATMSDARYAVTLLRADILAHAERGQYPTPELRAMSLFLRYGKVDALLRFVTPCWDAGEYPDPNVAWLLLHPDRMPVNFPMYCREVCNDY